MTGLSVKYIKKLRKAGTIRSYQWRDGGHFRYYRDDLLRHLEL